MRKLKAYLRYIFFMPVTVIKKSMAPGKYIFIDGCPCSSNFGDGLNIPLVEFLTDKKVLSSKTVSRFLFKLLRYRENYAVIGSVLQWVKQNAEVWGAGFMFDDKTFMTPSKVYAVRGPKTREVYLKHNIDCPAVYGDPALLCPLIYWPEVEKKYKLGIIPHYSDNDNEWVGEMAKSEDVLIIDLMVGTDYKKVIDMALSCEKIVSSSLHGIIIADAYRIPNRQIVLSDKVMGADFKFADYYLSVNREMQPAIYPVDTKMDDLLFNESIRIDIGKLIESCPFILEDKKTMILDKLYAETRFEHLRG